MTCIRAPSISKSSFIRSQSEYQPADMFTKGLPRVTSCFLAPVSSGNYVGIHMSFNIKRHINTHKFLFDMSTLFVKLNDINVHNK